MQARSGVSRRLAAEPSRRQLIRSLVRGASIFAFDRIISGLNLDVQFVNIAREAGLHTKTVFGGEKKNKYLLETTGCGAAFFDYDNDGWLDIFLVNGTRFEASWAPGEAPVSRLYKNNRDGTFTDVTSKAGLTRTGWGQGVCVGDYDNDGRDDLFVTYWGENALYHNDGNGRFTDVSVKAGLATAGKIRRWNTGCAFLDYDRDGHLDLFVSNYINFDPKTAPLPESGPCRYKDLLVACGPPGLQGAKNILFHNNGDGTFRDVSRAAGILDTPGTYGLGVIVSDFDDDGWPDIYVANDSASSALYRNNHDGTFTEIAIEAGVAYSPDGKSQAGMGVSVADYDHDGRFDIVKTNFAGDTSSLYHNLGKHLFDDRTSQSGLGKNTRFMGWGVGFFDFDNDGWADILACNGHVYPEVGQPDDQQGYKQRKVLYRNLRNGRFEDISLVAGPGIREPAAARGCAFGDFDNDGNIDVLINCVNDVPQLLRCDSSTRNNWLKVRTIGTKSNRSGIGARIRCVTPDGMEQMDEVRSGGGYISQNDLRVHFGLAGNSWASLEIRWPSGLVEHLTRVNANQVIEVKEGENHP